MKKIITHYFCITDVGLNEANNTELYYYSGAFINETDICKKIAELPPITRLEIELKMAEVVRKNPLKFMRYEALGLGDKTKIGSGYMIDKDGCLLMLYSQNRIELFEINLFGITPKTLSQNLVDGYLNSEITEHRLCAVLVCTEQNFEIVL